MTTVDRRVFLRAGLAVTGFGVLSACTSGATGSSLVRPTDPRVREVEAARGGTGRTRPVTLTTTAGHVDLGGPWSAPGQGRTPLGGS